jgi:hypothetical protein
MAPTPSFGLHELTAAATHTDFFDMSNPGYTNAFFTDDMPMEYGTLADVLNWVRKPIVPHC